MAVTPGTDAQPAPAAAERRPGWTSSELSWAAAVGLCLTGLTTLPYLWAAARSGFGWQYLGFVYNPDEPNVHLSWIRQAAHGAWFFRNEFTSEPHTGAFFNLFMLGCGRLAGWLGWSPYAAWALARVVWVPLAVLAVWAAAAWLTPRPAARRLIVLTVALSSGLGWLSVALGSSFDVVDVEPGRVMPEAITFLSLYLNPLFTSSMVLLLGAVCLGAEAIRSESWRPAVAAGLLGFVLANQHTYDVIPLALVLLAWTLDQSLSAGWTPRRWGLLALIGGLCAPAVLYQALLIRGDPLYAAKANTITATEPLGAMLLSYGLLLPLAIGGAWASLRAGQVRTRLLVWWAILQFICIYLPTSLFPFQRKMTEGLHLPLAMLAALGLLAAAEWLAGRIVPQATPQPRWRSWSKGLALAGLLALAPSNLLFVQSTLDNLATNNAGKLDVLMPPFMLPDADLAAVDWFGANSPPDAVLLCLPMVGNYVPGRVGRTVYVGHWAETIAYGQKLGAYRSFLEGRGSVDERTAWLHDNRITYVLVGSYEQQLTGFRPEDLPALELVFTSRPSVQTRLPARLYRVKS